MDKYIDDSEWNRCMVTAKTIWVKGGRTGPSLMEAYDNLKNNTSGRTPKFYGNFPTRDALLKAFQAEPESPPAKKSKNK